MAITENPQWRDWMVAAQGGDQKAYVQLLKEISPLLHHYVAKRLFDTQAVEDTVQEILIGLHKMRGTYDAKQAFTPWLMTIAKYKTIDAMRHSQNKTKHIAGHIEDENFFFDETLSAAAPNNIDVGTKKDIEEALNTLPEKQKNIVSLLKIQGYSIKETAEMLNMTQGAVKITAHRGYKQLKKQLTAYDT